MRNTLWILAALAFVACDDGTGPGEIPTLTLSVDSTNVAVGASTNVTATITFSNDVAVFTSRDNTIATVTASGAISGVKAGRTVVVAALAGNSAVRDSVIVVVTGQPNSGQPRPIPLLGTGTISHRYTAEIAVAGQVAYTTTWGFRAAAGNTLYIWNVSGNTPMLADSVVVSSAGTLSDVQISNDGSLLVVSVEGGGSAGNGVIIYNRSNPTKPIQITRYIAPNTSSGVHTVKLSRINGRHYAFLQINAPSRLAIVDITNPAQPVEVHNQLIGNPFIHDVFVRDGILFTALWDDGLSIFDVGGGGRGGSPSSPVLMGNVKTINGNVHNVWWFHNPLTGEKKYAFVGEEVPGNLGGFQNSMGDVHVVDVSNLSAPVEVAIYRPLAATTSTGNAAGAHNFVMDEQSGILYSAFYNGGVRALDVRGDLSVCTQDQRSIGGLCDLRLMGREVGIGVSSGGQKVIWGVALVGNDLYASDMLNGIHKLDVSTFKR